MDLAPIVTGVVTGAVVAFVTFRLQRGLERERWDREDKLRREELDRLARERWIDDKRKLFARFLRLVEGMREASRDFYEGEPPLDWYKGAEEAYNLTVEIALIEPTLEKPADAAYETALKLAAEASNWRHDLKEEGKEGAVEPPDGEGREKTLNKAVESFMAAAQSRLRPARLAD